MTDATTEETTEKPRRKRTRKPGPTLEAALVAAQAAVEQASHDKRTDFGQRYTYASAEEVIRVAKSALNANGLALLPGDMHYSTEDGCGAVFTYSLVHESGARHTSRRGWPLVEGKGRPLDKAMAAASTNCLAYYLRELLLIERPGAKDDMNVRDDSAHEPRRPQHNNRAQHSKQTVKLPTSRSELIAKMSPDQIKDKVLAGSRQIMALEPSETEADELVELTQGDYSPAMLAGVWDLFDKVKSRMSATHDVSLF